MVGLATIYSNGKEGVSLSLGGMRKYGIGYTRSSDQYQRFETVVSMNDCEMVRPCRRGRQFDLAMIGFLVCVLF